MDDKGLARQRWWCQRQVEAVMLTARWTVVGILVVSLGEWPSEGLRCNKCKGLGLGGEAVRLKDSFRVSVKVLKKVGG